MRNSSTREGRLVELEAVSVATLLAQLVKLCHLLADIVTDVQLAVRGHHLEILLILQVLLTAGVVADYFTALSLVLFDLREAHNVGTMGALDAEGVDDFFDDSRRSPDLDIKVAHGTVLVHDQPVLNAKLTVQFVAVVAFFGVSAHF